MTEENPLTIAELGAYTNNSMNREGIKKLVDKVNNGGGSGGDAYTKAETDALLDDKQDVLTAGTNITIENNVISATGGGSSESWVKIVPTAWSDLLYDATSTQFKIKRDFIIKFESSAGTNISCYKKDMVFKMDRTLLNSAVKGTTGIPDIKLIIGIDIKVGDINNYNRNVLYFAYDGYNITIDGSSVTLTATAKYFTPALSQCESYGVEFYVKE